tara:strand:+ start:352 stop:465 length:114 start_codon:yes stop_codon:yes gene_type:complete
MKIRKPLSKETKDTLYFIAQVSLLLIIALAIEYIRTR